MHKTAGHPPKLAHLFLKLPAKPITGNTKADGNRNEIASEDGGEEEKLYDKDVSVDDGLDDAAVIYKPSCKRKGNKTSNAPSSGRFICYLFACVNIKCCLQILRSYLWS